MNIGNTGLYFDEWWFLLLMTATCAYFAFLLQVYRRNKRSSPTRRLFVHCILVILTVFVMTAVVLAFHDLAFAGQNYEREGEVDCLSHPKPFTSKTKAIVVAKYKENTTWLECPEYSEHPNLDWVIYEKKKEAALEHMDKSNHHYLENIGYECPAYMKYILDHYTQLPDMVYFVHGNPYEHCSKFGHAFTQVEEEDFYIFSVWNWRFKRSGWPHYWPHQGFAAIMDRTYRELFQTDPPPSMQTYFNGQFMATREAILQHPPEFYRKILDLTTVRRDRTAYSWGRKGDGWMECCAMERLWHKVFTGKDEFPPYEDRRTYC